MEVVPVIPYPQTVSEWRQWLESTRYQDVGKDSVIDKGYCSLRSYGINAHITTALIDVLFDIATDRKVFLYQGYTAAILIGDIKTEEGITALNTYIRHVLENNFYKNFLVVEAIAAGIKNQESITPIRTDLLHKLLQLKEIHEFYKNEVISSYAAVSRRRAERKAFERSCEEYPDLDYLPKPLNVAQAKGLRVEERFRFSLEGARSEVGIKIERQQQQKTSVFFIEDAESYGVCIMPVIEYLATHIRARYQFHPTETEWYHCISPYMDVFKPKGNLWQVEMEYQPLKRLFARKQGIYRYPKYRTIQRD